MKINSKQDLKKRRKNKKEEKNIQIGRCYINCKCKLYFTKDNQKYWTEKQLILKLT